MNLRSKYAYLLLFVSGALNAAAAPAPGLIPDDIFRKTIGPFKLKVQSLSVMHTDPAFSKIPIQTTWTDDFRSQLHNVDADGTWLGIYKPPTPSPQVLSGPKIAVGISVADIYQMHFLRTSIPREAVTFYIQKNGHLRYQNPYEDDFHKYAKFPPMAKSSKDGYIPLIFSIKEGLQNFEKHTRYSVPEFYVNEYNYLARTGDDAQALRFWRCFDTEIPHTDIKIPYPVINYHVGSRLPEASNKSRCEQVVLLIVPVQK